MIYLGEILEATGGIILKGEIKADDRFTGVSIDSRTIKNGEVFFAIKGKRFDGHDFVIDALKKSKAALVSSYEKDRFLSIPLEDKVIISVSDTHGALKALATYLRKKRIRNLIGITGSNGKTTTKEMLFSILKRTGTAMKNEGNLNNEFGLPLSIINSDMSDYAVLEMGASRPGDIKILCEIALPDYGLITNIGRAHLEGFGDLESVARTKLELASYVKKIFLNKDNELLMRVWRDIYGEKENIVTFGIKNNADVMAHDIRIEGLSSCFRVVYRDRNLEVRLNVSGMPNIYNALASSAVALFLGVPDEILIEGLSLFSGVGMRFQVFEKNGVRYFVDAYNANPDSMKEAMVEFIRLKNKRTIAVLGDMLELGRYSEEFHREIGRLLRSYGVDIFIAVGKEMRFAAEEFSSGGEVFVFDTSFKAGEKLKEILRDGDTVFIKGSRGMRMEEVLNAC